MYMKQIEGVGIVHDSDSIEHKIAHTDVEKDCV